MAVQSTSAIVLHTIKYGDSSLIVDTYTREFGRMAFMVNGAHRKKSSTKANLFQPLFLLQLQVNYQPKRNLQGIREMSLQPPLASISDNIFKRTLALFLAEVVARTVREEEQNQSLYRFIEQSILLLEEEDPVPANFHLSFLLQLSAFLGFYPNDDGIDQANYFDLKEGDFTLHAPAHRHVINHPEIDYFKPLVQEKMSESMHFRIPKESQQQLIHQFLEYYRLQLGNFPEIRSLEILQAVFA